MTERYKLIRTPGERDQLVLYDSTLKKGQKVVEEEVLPPRVASTREKVGSRRAWRVDKEAARREAEQTRWRGMQREEMARELQAENAELRGRLELVEEALRRLDPDGFGKVGGGS